MKNLSEWELYVGWLVTVPENTTFYDSAPFDQTKDLCGQTSVPEPLHQRAKNLMKRT